MPLKVLKYFFKADKGENKLSLLLISLVAKFKIT